MSEWEIVLPFVKPPLNSNRISRMHWSEKGRLTQQVRRATAALVRNAGIPPMARCEVGLVWVVTDKRRRDADNSVPTLKACCDGIVDAGVVRDDTPDLMGKTMPIIRMGEKPEVIVTIRELP